MGVGTNWPRRCRTVPRDLLASISRWTGNRQYPNISLLFPYSIPERNRHFPLWGLCQPVSVLAVICDVPCWYHRSEVQPVAWAWGSEGCCEASWSSATSVWCSRCWGWSVQWWGQWPCLFSVPSWHCPTCWSHLPPKGSCSPQGIPARPTEGFVMQVLQNNPNIPFKVQERC